MQTERVLNLFLLRNIVFLFTYFFKMAVLTHADFFGEIIRDDGSIEKVKRFSISNSRVEIQVINYGATITSLKVPDKLGKLNDIVLGFDNLHQYANHSYYFGCTVGRFANRIAGGKFNLANETYSLAINNGPNHLHGGMKGFDKVIWDASTRDNKVLFSYISPSMEENYPGELKCNVTYELTDKDEVIIHYQATTTHLTPINLTNHSYFNLAGHGSGKIYDQIISVNADYYVPVNETSIPTGSINAVYSTDFDLRESKSFETLLNQIPGGLDHNFCINGDLKTEKEVAKVYHPKSGRLMEVYSTQPGVQLYTSNYLPEDNSLCGKSGKFYKKHGAFCLETQNYPDAVNHENFPKAVLAVGEVYNHTTRFVFAVK